MLSRSKLNSTETLISQALMDSVISRKEYSDERDELSENNKNIRTYSGNA